METINNILQYKLNTIKGMRIMLATIFVTFVVTHLFGWIINWSPFLLINENWIPMKLDVSIVFSAVLLTVYLPVHKNVWAGVILGLAFTSMLITFHESTYLYVCEITNDYLDKPGIGTIAGFYLLTLSIVWEKRRRFFCVLLGCLGLLGCVGYILGEALLYYEYGRYEAMLLHTCVLNIITAVWLYNE